MKEIKVLEWNINQRSGVGKGEIPDWIKDKILYADIVVLTEFCTQCDGRTKFINDLKYLGYHCITSENSTGNDNKFTGNDILIGVKSHLKISSCSWVPCYGVNCDKKYDDIPENLRVDIDCDGKILTVIGLRIKIVDSNFIKRYKEFQWVLEQTENIENPVLIAGDFNNGKRGSKDKDWNISIINEELSKKEFALYTPEGSSIYCVENYNGNEFPYDHFIIKGIKIKENQKRKKYVLWYDRSFVYKDKVTYEWGENFQKEPWYPGIDPDKIPSIAPPFPDHAILKGTFILE